MPNCFTLTRKDDKEPSALNHVDNVLCQALELPWSERSYTCGWFDDIGFSLACGKTLPDLVDRYRNDAAKCDAYVVHDLIMWRVAAYLNEHYTSDCFVEIGRR